MSFKTGKKKAILDHFALIRENYIPDPTIKIIFDFGKSQGVSIKSSKLGSLSNIDKFCF